MQCIVGSLVDGSTICTSNSRVRKNYCFSKEYIIPTTALTDIKQKSECKDQLT